MKYWAIIFLFIGVNCNPNTSTTVDWDSIPASSEPVHPSKVPGTLQVLLKLHNQERMMKGRPALELDEYLCQYAQTHADWMAQHSNLKHSNISNLMGKYSAAGENIAWNQENETTVVADWMNSPGHRANILNRSFSKVGFGVKNGSNGPYWCTVFAN